MSGAAPLALAVILSLAAAPLPAAVRLAVSGDSRLDGRALVIAVTLRNLGDTPAFALRVEAELDGRRAQGQAASLGPGAAQAFELRYPSFLARPGVYAIPLLLDYSEGSEEGAPERSEVGYLLVPLGGRPVPALRVRVGSARIDELGRVPVAVESADGAEHRALVSLRAPRGLNVLDPPLEIQVPAGGRAAASFRVIRAGAPHGGQVGVLATAGVVDGPLQRDAVAGGSVALRPARSWLTPLRLPLLVLAGALLVTAGVVEWRLRRAGSG